MYTLRTIEFLCGVFKEFLCGGAHFSRQIEDMRLGLGTNVFHQLIIMVGPLLLLPMEDEKVK